MKYTDETTVAEWAAELREEHPDLFEIYMWLDRSYYSRQQPGTFGHGRGIDAKMQARILIRKAQRSQGLDPDQSIPLPANWPIATSDPLSV